MATPTLLPVTRHPSPVTRHSLRRYRGAHFPLPPLLLPRHGDAGEDDEEGDDGDHDGGESVDLRGDAAADGGEDHHG